jgi:hypothetical protein
MRETQRRLSAFSWAWLFIPTLAAAIPTAALAQDDARRAWTVVPLLGFGVVRINESWNSAGMEAAIDLEYGGTAWRGNGYASVRGVGVSCSHACFDGGPAVGIGASRSVGAVWIGGGLGVMKQLGQWRLSPYGRISLGRAPLRFDFRVEFPQHIGSGIYFPVLVGVPISRRE